MPRQDKLLFYTQCLVGRNSVRAIVCKGNLDVVQVIDHTMLAGYAINTSTYTTENRFQGCAISTPVTDLSHAVTDAQKAPRPVYCGKGNVSLVEKIALTLV